MSVGVSACLLSLARVGVDLLYQAVGLRVQQTALSSAWVGGTGACVLGEKHPI